MRFMKIERSEREKLKLGKKWGEGGKKGKTGKLGISEGRMWVEWNAARIPKKNRKDDRSNHGY